MQTRPLSSTRVLITGASGYLGRQLTERLSQEITTGKIQSVVASDIHTNAPVGTPKNVTYIQWDIRSEGLENVFQKHNIDTVIHLASVVNPRKDQGSDFCYQVDVVGTKQVLNACLKADVKHIVVSSSGAAYGYHHDNPEWLKESDTIRGNKEFPYSYHKRLVEEMLEDYRKNHPALAQTVFRVGTILGDHTKNQITDLFEKRWMIGIQGYKSPFVFIWDQDLVEIFTQAVLEKKVGIFNVAGDGAVSIEEIAKRLKKRVLWIPATVLGNLLKVLHRFGLSQYSSDQVRFLQFRPALKNDKLKNEFGYIPKKSSLETFDYWQSERLRSK